MNNNKQKILLLVMIIVMVGAFYLVFSSHMYSFVENYERYDLNKELSFVQKTIQRESYHLYEKVAEWGIWDDTYDFVVNKNKNYIDRNLSSYGIIFKHGNYIIVFMDNDLNIVYGVEYQEKDKKVLELPLNVKILLNDKKLQAGKKGLLILNGSVYLSATHLIVNSKGMGSPRGLVTIMHELDTSIFEKQRTDKVSFETQVIEEQGPDIETDKKNLYIMEDKISESILINDIFGQPALRIIATLERHVMSYSKSTLLYLVLTLTFVSILFYVSFLHLLKRTSVLEKQVCEAEKLGSLGALGANISKELDQPLNTVYSSTKGLKGFMSKQNIKDNKLLNNIDKIINSTEKMMHTIRHIKEFTRYAEEDALTPENINSLIARSVDEIEDDLINKDIKLEFDLNPKLPSIFINPTKFTSVIHNLLMNAKEALEEVSHNKKKIKVMSKLEELENGIFIIIVVQDNGIGIAKTDITKIFQPYYTTKGYSRGSGLGLSLVQGVIKEYNGTIEVNSKSGNTEFIIKFPINPLLDAHREIK